MKGKFIVLYGVNNLGKSVQLDLLGKFLAKKNILFKRLKYPVYDLEPTGLILNEIVRGGRHMPEDYVQRLYVQNRREYEPFLKKDLEDGYWVIAEDYIGTGIAWGMIRGLSLEEGERINDGLLKEDLAIVLHGERFLSGKEEHHRNESSDKMWKEAQEKHMQLADRYGWSKVWANQSPEDVNKDIVKILKEKKVLK